MYVHVYNNVFWEGEDHLVLPLWVALLAAGEATTPAQRNPLLTPVKQVRSMQASVCIDHTHPLGPWFRPVKVATFFSKRGDFPPKL